MDMERAIGDSELSKGEAVPPTGQVKIHELISCNETLDIPWERFLFGNARRQFIDEWGIV